MSIAAGNHWHADVKGFVDKLLNEDRFCWVDNSAFKYVNIRIDTRSGKFLVYDQDNNRVDIEQVLWQYSKETPTPPKSVYYEEKMSEQ